ncbi:Uncharacterized protein Fot_20404 [Forsythia ovata]|uniref:Uncharacterized protein n=1 Tax=Forsythia ovata TaxID=205694 RepID=A0ABD1VQX3_9LAMI
MELIAPDEAAMYGHSSSHSSSLIDKDGEAKVFFQLVEGNLTLLCPLKKICIAESLKNGRPFSTSVPDTKYSDWVFSHSISIAVKIVWVQSKFLLTAILVTTMASSRRKCTLLRSLPEKVMGSS